MSDASNCVERKQLMLRDKKTLHMKDALALIGEEGRGKLRKASGSRTQALIRRYPNGETCLG